MNPDKLKQAMKQKGLTQKDVARLTNSTQAEVSRFMNNKGNPTMAKLRKFVEILGLELIDECFRDDGNDAKN